MSRMSVEYDDGRDMVRRSSWRPEEDARLVQLVNQYGPCNWTLIAQSLGSNPPRSGKSCRLRWCNQLNPKIKKEPFTMEEERMIVEKHKELGNKWAAIAKFLPGRTDNAVKNYWNGHLKKKLAAQGQLGYHADTDDEPEDSETMDAEDGAGGHHGSGSHHHHGHHHAEVTSQQHYRQQQQHYGGPSSGSKRQADGRRREQSSGYDRIPSGLATQQPAAASYPAAETSGRTPLPISVLHQVFAELINTMMEQNLPAEQRCMLEQTMGATMGRMLANAVANDPNAPSSAAVVQQMLALQSHPAFGGQASGGSGGAWGGGRASTAAGPPQPQPRTDSGASRGETVGAGISGGGGGGGGVVSPGSKSWGVRPDGQPKLVQQSLGHMLWERQNIVS